MSIAGDPGPLPGAEKVYLESLVETLRNHLTDRLVGVYLFGSGAYGDYVPGVSDLDVQAVVSEPLGAAERREVTASLSHDVLPCPARRLEFVCYARNSINPAVRHPWFEVNINTGAGALDHLSLDPSEEPSHWFVLDIAVGRERGQAVVGPPPADVFAPIPRLWQLQAMADSLAWHQVHEPTSPNAVLNACRAWRYAVTGELGSKAACAAWVSRDVRWRRVVEQAGQCRQDGGLLGAAAVRALNAAVADAVRVAIRAEASLSG